MDETLAAITEGTGLKVQRMGDVYMIIPLHESENKAPVAKMPDESIPATGFVYGQVRDKFTGETLPYASIYVSTRHLGTNTNSDGYFRMELPSADTVNFVINYLGYAPIVCKSLPQKTPQLQIFQLIPDIQQLEAVEVRDKIEIFDNSGTNTEHIKFSPSKMGNIPSLTELDMMTPLQMLPGINATNENSGGFSIRKSMPDKTLMVYDGFTLYHMNHFFGAFSSINTKAVKDIQVYKGGFGAAFGGSASGIIDITGKSGNMQKPVINIGIDMLAADAAIEVPIIHNKCSLLVAGRRSYTDAIRTPLYNSLFDNVRYDFNAYYRNPPAAFSENKNAPVYYYDDLNAKFTFRLPGDGVIEVTTFNSADKISYGQAQTFPKIHENTHWATNGASARWATNFLPAWHSEVIWGISKTVFAYNYDDSIQRVRKKNAVEIINYVNKTSLIDSWFKNNSLTWNNTFEIRKNQKIEAGISVQKLASRYNYNAETFFNHVNLMDTTRLYEKDARLSALWFQYEFSGEGWNIKPGLRLNSYSIIKKSYPEFRLAALCRISPVVQVRGNLGNYFQFVNKLDITRRGDFRSAWVISDGSKIPVVASFQGSLGINIALTSSINLDIEGYYKKLRNLTSPLDEYRFVDGKIKIRNAGWLFDSEIKGIDILLKQSYGNYQLWTAYTLSTSQSFEKRGGKSLAYPSDDDQLHELKLLHLFKLHNFFFSFSNIYGSGGIWDHYILTKNLQLSSDYQKNGAQMPAYFRFDAGVNYSIYVKNTMLKIGSNFFNILNTHNVIQRFDKLSLTPVEDIAQGINPLEENTVYGLGFSWNLFLNFSF